MLKNNRNIAVDLRRRKSYINLDQFNHQSIAIIGMIVMIMIVSILCVSAFPNSNAISGI